MTEYTPTEPEIEKALQQLSDFMDARLTQRGMTRRQLDPDAEGTTLAVVRAILDLVDEPGFDAAERIRAARAAVEARRRWAEQETKAA